MSNAFSGAPDAPRRPAPLGVALVFLMSATALSTTTRADPGGISDHMQRMIAECRSDALRVCFGVIPGGGRVVRCMLENRDKLSGSCRNHADTVVKFQEMMAICETDRREHCDGVEAGDGRVLQCLSRNSRQLSKPCHSAMLRAEESVR